MSLLNKVAIVTGAGSGFGAAIAHKLTEEEAQVVIVGRNKDNLMNTCKACETRGLKPLMVIADVTLETDAKRIIDKTLSAFGKIDILINNAGIANRVSIFDKNAMSAFDKVLLTNYRAPVHLTHLASEHLCATKGNIINIGTVMAHLITLNDTFSYTSSKAALESFTKCIARELAPKGVRVNMVCPGPAKTNIFRKPISEIYWKNFERIAPLNKTVEVTEVAEMVAFILSEKSNSITGSSIVMDYGFSVGNDFNFSKS